MATLKPMTNSDGGPVFPRPRQLAKSRIADQIIAELRAHIASGAYPRGGRLPTERELAASYGVSAPTVREALRALTAMGLVEVRHGSGAYVAARSDGLLDGALAMLVQLEDVGILDLIRLLRVLNLYVAESAVEYADADDIERLRAAAEATAHCETVDEVTSSVTEFLIAFVATAHQPLLDALCGFLIRLVVQLEASSYQRRSAEFWRQWAAETSVFRLDIVRALEAYDRERLAAEVTRFHEAIRDRIMSVPALSRTRMSDPAIAPFLANILNSRH
jgi:GntR family transcriptional repressor for pyruvate dehydrogenase complex